MGPTNSLVSCWCGAFFVTKQRPMLPASVAKNPRQEGWTWRSMSSCNVDLDVGSSSARVLKHSWKLAWISSKAGFVRGISLQQWGLTWYPCVSFRGDNKTWIFWSGFLLPAMVNHHEKTPCGGDLFVAFSKHLKQIKGNEQHFGRWAVNQSHQQLWSRSFWWSFFSGGLILEQFLKMFSKTNKPFFIGPLLTSTIFFNVTMVAFQNSSIWKSFSSPLIWGILNWNNLGGGALVVEGDEILPSFMGFFPNKPLYIL